MSSTQKKLLFIFLLSLLPLVFGDRSGLQLYRLKKAVRDLNQELTVSLAEKKHIESEMKQLVSNPHTQVKAIRQVLGYVRSDETIFSFQSTSPHATRTR